MGAEAIDFLHIMLRKSKVGVLFKKTPLRHFVTADIGKSKLPATLRVAPARIFDSDATAIRGKHNNGQLHLNLRVDDVQG